MEKEKEEKEFRPIFHNKKRENILWYFAKSAEFTHIHIIKRNEVFLLRKLKKGQVNLKLMKRDP